MSESRIVKKIDTSFPSPGLGSMMMGWRLSFSDSKKIFSLAHSNNITFIDTSISYARGDCHRMIARVLESLKLKNKFYIATKVGGISDKNDRHFGYSKKNILRQCDLSLTQLNIETIDLLQLHAPTCSEMSNEILETLGELKKQGKIQNYGLCNFQKDDLIDFITYAKKKDALMPISNQFEYNLLNYHAQNALISWLHSNKMAIITWGLLAGGILTNWYLENSVIKPNSRIKLGRELQAKSEILQRRTTQEVLKNISRLSKKFSISPQVLSALWAMKTQPKNCMLLGPSSFAQFKELIDGINKFKENKIDFCNLKEM
jgi:aryl-alcohol dehydrogenase-like predicted oxidoreductase